MITVLVLFAISFVSLGLFRFLKPKLLLLSLSMAFAFDLVVFWDAFSYYEGRLPMILSTIVQLALQAMLAVYMKDGCLKGGKDDA